MYYTAHLNIVSISSPNLIVHLLYLAVRFCGSCTRIKEREEQETPRAFEPLDDEDKDSKAMYALACFKGEQFRVGDGVYLPPEAFNFR